MKSAHISRRNFIKHAATAAGAALAFPYIVPSSIFGANAPSSRIVMGAIGVGGQGTVNLHGFLGKSVVQVVAIADVDAGHLNNAVGIVNGHYGNKGCKGY